MVLYTLSPNQVVGIVCESRINALPNGSPLPFGIKLTDRYMYKYRYGYFHPTCKLSRHAPVASTRRLS